MRNPHGLPFTQHHQQQRKASIIGKIEMKMRAHFLFFFWTRAMMMMNGQRERREEKLFSLSKYFYFFVGGLTTICRNGATTRQSEQIAILPLHRTQWKLTSIYQWNQNHFCILHNILRSRQLSLSDPDTPHHIALLTSRACSQWIIVALKSAACRSAQPELSRWCCREILYHSMRMIMKQQMEQKCFLSHRASACQKLINLFIPTSSKQD